ncbi:hypothetical protein DFH06DRAFT_1327351 [Mycena polygramma]|nr:hypothetical protein DFH06DRAFT_1327351 [Mycena polygramma]
MGIFLFAFVVNLACEGRMVGPLTPRSRIQFSASPGPYLCAYPALALRSHCMPFPLQGTMCSRSRHGARARAGPSQQDLPLCFGSIAAIFISKLRRHACTGSESSDRFHHPSDALYLKLSLLDLATQFYHARISFIIFRADALRRCLSEEMCLAMHPVRFLRPRSSAVSVIAWSIFIRPFLSNRA